MIMAILRATLYQLFLIVTVIPYAIACILWSPLPLRWRYKLTVGWPRLAVWGAKTILGIRWQLKGAENFPDGPAILLSKHQSAWERSEEHTSELQSLMRISYAVFCLKKKNN